MVFVQIKYDIEIDPIKVLNEMKSKVKDMKLKDFGSIFD